MELSQPLAVIDGLFAQAQAKGEVPPSWGERAHFIQALNLQDEEAFCRIPCINEVANAESVPPFSLVRYRGLVQDIFEPEMYVATLEETDAVPQTPPRPAVLRTTKYREYIEPAAGRTLNEVGRRGLGQRGACYCVPLPGETAWARAAAKAGSASASSNTSMNDEPAPPRAKRGRDFEDAEEVTMTDAALEMPASRSRTEATSPVATATKAGVNADEFGLNFPLPWEEARGRGCSTACIVKTYDEDAEAMRLCDIVEFVGVLCVNPEMANLAAAEEDFFGSDARHPSTALVPRLHALAVRKLSVYHPSFPFTPQFLTEGRLATAYQASFTQPAALAVARQAAIAQLARHLGADALAAEFVLMQLLSRSFATHGDQLLGTWSLNLARWPTELGVQAFADGVGQLTPRSVCLEVNASTLSTKNWKPRKDFTANRLVAGQLQLAPGTFLVLDETKMAEGQLTAAGVKAITAIGNLVTDHSLHCDFAAYDVPVPLELYPVLVSNGRSIIKDVSVTLPLRPEPAAAAAVSRQPVNLDAARLFIGFATRSPKALDIPDEVASRLAGDFSDARQEFQVPSSLCNTWLSLARAHCLSYGEQTLSLERWLSVGALERQRLVRCREAGMLAPVGNKEIRQ